MVCGSGVTHRRRSSPYRNSRSPPQRRGDRPEYQGSCRQTRRAASPVHTQCRAVGPESCVCRPHLRRTVFVTTGGTLLYSLSGKPKQNAADVADPCKKGFSRTRGWVLTETFLGADKKPISVNPKGRAPAASNEGTTRVRCPQ